jgi:NAD-dependent dihydropyrimidine dehydrogenase PreA subunit
LPPRIDPARCDKCGICVFECPFSLFKYHPRVEKIVFTQAKECVDCFICEVRCPQNAIEITIKRS